MRATLSADASYCQRSGSAGWGVWVKADGEASHTFHGAFHQAMKSAHDAEACAIANGLYLALTANKVRKGMTVMIQSDCAGVLSHIRRAVPSARDNPAPVGKPPKGKKPLTPVLIHAAKHAPRSPPSIRAMDLIERLVVTHRLTLEVRHVRGHKSVLGGRHAVNGICDRLAYRSMQDAR